MTQLHVFPIRTGSKAPAIKNWQQNAQPLADWLSGKDDPAGAQWALHERWGAPCGPLNDFWVLDVDPRHGGLESLKALCDTYGELVCMYTVRTPSGGYHYYFKWQDICALISNTAGVLGPGLDIRTVGGMVLVPPTAGYEPQAPAGSPALAPPWLLALLLPRPKAHAASTTDGEAPIRNPRQWGARAIASAIDEIKQAPAGSRDATMNRNAYGLGRVVVACGLSRDSVVDLLVTTAIDAGYDAHKALDCCQRAVDAGMQNPREVAAATVPQAGGVPVVPADDALGALRPLPPKPGKQPADLTSAAGVRWTREDNEYREWHRTLRENLDARLVVVQYDQSRVLYERFGLRRVEVRGASHVQIAAVKRIGEAAGLLVPTGTAETAVVDYLTQAHAISENPTMWDDGEHLFRWETPALEEGPTPTWDTILDRLSDPDAFLAHVWAAFEPKYKGRQVLWLQGEGNDGKSIALASLFEGAGCAYASLGDNDLTAGNQFVFSSIWDKPVVLVGESKNVNVLMTGMVHKLTGRDPIPVEYKHGQRFNARFQGVVFVTSNNRPQLEDTRANVSRLTLVTIRPGGWVDDLEVRLRREVPALLHRAQGVYARACPRHFEIALNEESQRLLSDSTKQDSDKHASTLRLIGLRIEGDDFMPRVEIVSRLMSNSGTRMEDSKLASFYRWLEKQPGVRAAKIEGVRGFRGLKQ